MNKQKKKVNCSSLDTPAIEKYKNNLIPWDDTYFNFKINKNQKVLLAPMFESYKNLKSDIDWDYELLKHCKEKHKESYYEDIARKEKILIILESKEIYIEYLNDGLHNVYVKDEYLNREIIEKNARLYFKELGYNFTPKFKWKKIES